VSSVALRAPTPIVVGVTGHRDLRPQDVAELERCVDEFFAELSARYPDSDVIVLSGLARGADRLVARRALALGRPLVALLPMPRSDYEADFVEPADLAEFGDIAAQSTRLIEIPWAHGAHGTGDTARAAQYALLGDALVENASIVLALWNGHVTGLAGGTDAVLAMAQRGRGEGALAAFDRHAAPFVYRIVTPRESYAATEGEPFSRTSLDDAGDDACLRSLGNQDRWNRDAAPLWPADSAGEAFAGRDVIARTFAIADTLAIREQTAEQRAFRAVYLIGAAAAVIFGAYGNLFSRDDWLLGIDVAITVAGFLVYAIAMSRNAPDRFQDYRALAEGLRVQEAWSRAGVAADVADHYAHRQRSALDWIESEDPSDVPASKLNWIRRTIRVARQLYDFSPDEPHDRLTHRDRIRAVHAEWIVPQAQYFSRAAARKAAAAKRCRTAWRMLALGALACTVVLFVAECIPASRPLADGAAKSEFFFTIGMLTLCSAIVQNYADKRAFGTLHKQYVAMHRMFATAADVVAGLVDGEFDERRAKAVIFEIGREALAENADWMIALRDRPLEIVLSG